MDKHFGNNEKEIGKPHGDVFTTDNDEAASLNKINTEIVEPVRMTGPQQQKIPSLLITSNTSGIKVKQGLTKFQLYRTLLGCFIIHLVIGTLYIWGGISPYVASYLHHKDSSVTRQSVSLIFPFMSLICNFSTTVGVKVCDRFAPKYVVIFCAILVVLCVLIVSFMETLAGYFIIYMIFFAFFSGMLYLIPVKIAWGYFPNNKGTVSGLIVMGYGFGGFIFNFVCKAIINPDNVKASIAEVEGGETVHYFQKSEADNIPKMFQILFACYTFMFIIGWLLIKFPHFEKPIDHPIHHHTHQDHPHKHHNSWAWHVIKLEHEHNHHRFLPECQTMKEGLKTYAFWSMFFLAVTMIYFGQFMINQYKNYGIANPDLNDDNYLTTIGSVASACNGSSRLMWAYMFDKFGFRKVFFTVASVQAVLSATMHLTVNSRAFYGAWLCLTLTCMGCYFATFPGHTHKIFGHKLGAQFYSFVLIGIGVANMVAFFTRQFGVSFDVCFWIGLAFSITGLFLAFFQRKAYLWEVDDDGVSLQDGLEGPVRNKSVLSINMSRAGKGSFYKISQLFTSNKNLENKGASKDMGSRHNIDQQKKNSIKPPEVGA